jgi:protein-tyrosine phosphatase
VSADPTRIEMIADPLTRILSGVTMHGLMQFDVPFISEIAPNLWQGGCTNGLVLPVTFRHLVSLYPWEAYSLKHELDSAVVVTMLDSLDQELDRVSVLAGWVNACRKTGPVLVQCQAGLNRSSLVTATALMLEGMPAEKAIALLREKRSPACLCNPAFEEWLRAFPAPVRLKLADYRRLYTRRGTRAHLAGPYGGTGVLCAVEPGAFDDWLGTGDQREYERAASLPLCRQCKSAFGAALADAA